MINKKCIKPISAFPVWVWFLVYFLTALAFGYHGFSIDSWREYVHPSSSVNILGRGQGVRSDDFFVGLPTAFSQSHNDFASSSNLIGFAQNNLVTSYQIPVKHWTALFKPLTWGYFFNPDLGLSWHWNLNVVFLGLAIVLFLINFSNFSSKTIFWLTAGIYFSDFFHFWSYIGAPFFYWPLFLVLIIKHFDIAKNLGRRLVLGVLYSWILSCFVFTVYPPFQIFGVYFVLIFAIHSLIFSKQKKSLFGFLILAAIPTLALLALWLRDNLDTIKIINSTLYPGKRFSSGGNGSWIKLVQNNFYIKDAYNTSPLLGPNVSEGSGFWSPYLVIIMMVPLWWNKLDISKKVLTIISLFVILFYFLWYFFGLPSLVAQLSGLAMSVEKRSIIFTGFLNLIFLVILSYAPRSSNRKHKLLFFGAWLLINILSLAFYCPHEKGPLAGAIGMSLFSGFAVWKLIDGRTEAFAKIWASAMILSTVGFNPIAIKGHEALFEKSELASAALQTDSGKNHIWLVDKHVVLSSLPRALGLKSFGGPIFYPQFEFWDIVDKNREYENIWNRYSTVIFNVTQTERPQVELLYEDRIQINISPESRLLEDLYITRILQWKSNTDNITPKGFQPLKETSCCVILGRE